jgi:tetratricopeptide (TPR) repeat protein
MGLKVIKIIFYVVSFCFISLSTFAQTRPKSVNKPKYDIFFNGIGPEAYFLPQPRRPLAVIKEDYKSINSFSDSISRNTSLQELINNYENCSNYNTISKLIETESISLVNWNEKNKNYLDEKSNDLTIGIFNEIAKKYIEIEAFDKAEDILKQALSISNRQHNIIDKTVVQNNLSSLYLFTNKLADADNLEKEVYKEAKKNNLVIEQSKSLIRVALIDAYKNRYSSAENTMIKRVLPLLDKTNNDESKIYAWIKLAHIYSLNKQYPQVLWFLIQAQDLAKNENINKYNAEIEFMLGSAKYHQKNLNVSKVELTKAMTLAKEKGNKYLELSALQLLGEISLQQNNIDEAETFLQSYWELRNQLF